MLYYRLLIYVVCQHHNQEEPEIDLDKPETGSSGNKQEHEIRLVVNAT